MLADYWAHTYFEDPEALENAHEDDEFDPDAVESLLNNSKPDDWEEIA